jgi:hypothetical protein
MATKSFSMSFSDLLSKSTVMSDNIKLNATKVGKYGLDLPEFTTEMDADISKADTLNKEQERLKSELKVKTEELNLIKDKLEGNYALAKKTVKLAEPQANWVAYGIDDKR